MNNTKKRKKRKSAKKRGFLRGLTAFILTIIIIAAVVFKIPAISTQYINEENFSKVQLYKTVNLPSTDIYKGELILVNSVYDYHFDLGEEKVPVESMKNTSYQAKDSEIALNKITINQFNKMFKAFESKTGLNNIRVISAYRTYEYQDGLFSDRVNSDGYYEAKKWVALPGYSEHHTGYTADIAVADEDGDSHTFTGEDEYSFIPENAWKYGFILRYPNDKTDITNIAYESWHYRYVGKPHAYIMHTTGMCLEEYENYVKSYMYPDKYIDLNINGDEYKIYYVPVSGEEKTKVTVPMFGSYSISGNNSDGFIVTEKD